MTPQSAAQSGGELAHAPIPANACDCHIHIYGPRERYPLATSSPFDPPLATVDAYRQVMRALGVGRVVLVQAAAYGTDNACMLDALRELADAAKGIATVTPEIPDAELARLTEAGVRGARVLLFPGGCVALDAIPALAARIKPFGWHVQLQMDGRQLPLHETMLANLPVPLVIDHNGKFIEPVTPDHPAMQSLLRLLKNGNCWVKASAPYETSKSGPPAYADVSVIARTLIAEAPTRVVWASNWPHGAVKGAKPDTRGLLNVLDSWVPDLRTKIRILVDNPAALYGFA